MLTYARLDSPVGRFVQTSHIIHHISNRITASHQAVRLWDVITKKNRIFPFHFLSVVSEFHQVSFKMSILKSHRFSYPIWLRFGESYIFLLLGVHCRLGRRSMNRSPWLACQSEMPVSSRLDPCRMCFRKIDECFLGLEV